MRKYGFGLHKCVCVYTYIPTYTRILAISPYIASVNCHSNYISICDRVCKNQPSSRTKIARFFSNISYHNLCSIYTNKLNVLPQMHNLIGDPLKFTE